MDSPGTIRAMMDLMISTGTSSFSVFSESEPKHTSDLLGPRRKI